MSPPSRCDVAVIGLGLIGSAALHALTRAGVDAIGFDPLSVGAAQGSSHGTSRVFRLINFEHPDYTDLARTAQTAWRALEAETGTSLLRETEVLEAGPPHSAIIAGSRAAAASAGQPSRLTTAAAANAAFPALALPDDWQVCLQPGGILLAQAALGALRAATAAHVVPEPAHITPTPDGIRVQSAGATCLANTVILATGPWIGTHLPQLAPHLRVTRQHPVWFQPRDPDAVAHGRLPIFLIDGPDGLVYGFPDFEHTGVKAALHVHGAITDAEDWKTQATPGYLATLGATLAAYVPGAAGPVLRHETCLYTNTLPADVTPDQGDEFIVDRLPQDPRIVVASACSGHGAKFASTIGPMLARLAMDANDRPPPRFRLDRFSGLAIAAQPFAPQTGAMQVSP